MQLSLPQPHTKRPDNFEMLCLLSTALTASIIAPVHVELAPHRCEAVAVSGGRRGAKGVAGEVEPGHGSRVVDVEVVSDTCHDKYDSIMIPAQEVTECVTVKRRLGRAAVLCAITMACSAVRHLRLAVVRTHHLTTLILATEDVDPAVDRRESMP